MILNILVCAFLLGMVVLWSTYGLFPAFLNLLVTVAAGLTAFALWEPAAHWMLGMGWSSSAWGFGLLLPYAVLFIALRLGVLAAVRKNLGFHPVVDQVGGGALGLAAGALTAGVLVIGAGMMQTDKGLLSVQKFRLSEDGTVVLDKKDGVSLWLPVDRIAGGLFEALSAGAFRPSGDGPTLASAHPGLAEAAEKYRLSVDPMATRTAAPGAGIKVVGAYAMDASPAAFKWLMRRSAAYAVMKKDAVDEIWKGENLKQVDSRLGDLVAATIADKQDPETALFDGKYLGNADRRGVRGLLGRPVKEQAESVLRRMWTYADDQIPDPQAAKDGKAPEPVQKLFTKFGPDRKLVVVDTTWDKDKSMAYDEGVLRLSPHQVQLVVQAGKTQGGIRLSPLAWSTPVSPTPPNFARRELVELDGGKLGIYGKLADVGTLDRLAFVFSVPKDAEVQAIELRGLRFALGKSSVMVAAPDTAAGAALAQVIGHILPPGDPEAKPAEIANENKTPDLPLEAKAPLGTLDFSNGLPYILDWTNPDEQHSKYIQEKHEVSLISGEFEKEMGKSMGMSILKMTKIHVGDGLRCVRLMLTLDQCKTVWGTLLDSAERGNQELVVRTEGRQLGAAGFVLARSAGSVLVVRIDPNGKFKLNGKVLADLRPVMADGDRLYVYFFVDESETLQGYGLYDADARKPNASQQYDMAPAVPMKRVPKPR